MDNFSKIDLDKVTEYRSRYLNDKLDEMILDIKELSF
jgi:hypothetical protein